jgi:hypothetical protein
MVEDNYDLTTAVFMGVGSTKSFLWPFYANVVRRHHPYKKGKLQ